MNTRFLHIVTVFAAFSAGLCTGLMIAPQSGKGLRRHISREAKSQLKRAEEKLKFVESQLNQANDRVQTAGKAFGDKMRAAANEVADDILPDLTKGSEAWDLNKNDMERELRNLTRR